MGSEQTQYQIIFCGIVVNEHLFTLALQAASDKKLMKPVDLSSIPMAQLLSEEIMVRWRPLSDDDLLWRPGRDVMDLLPQSRIIAVQGQTHSWVLPWPTLYQPHVANLLMNGQPTLISACGVCSTATAYLAEVNGKRLNFQVMGQWNGASLIVDTTTWSAWSGITGGAVSGPLKGTRLLPVALYQSTWQEWRIIDPNCLVGQTIEGRLVAEPKFLRPKLPRYFQQTLLHPLDERLPKNQLVLGIQINGVARCYTLVALDQAGLCLNEVEIAIFHLPGSWAAAAYSRRLGEQILIFEDIAGTIQDQNSSSTWSFLGEAMSGPLAGQQLAPVTSAVQEWYIWAAYHPETEIIHYNEGT